MEYEKRIFVCEDNIEGILTAVYDGWSWRVRGRTVEISVKEPECPEFFTVTVPVSSDSGKAQKVLRTMRDKLGFSVYEALCYAAVSSHPDKGTLIFRVLWQALSGKRCDRHVMENLADPDVNQVSKLRMKVWHELHRYYGFVRFREIGGKVLFSKISPENDILEMLSPHFENRFPNEHWMIYDERRQKVLLHPAGGTCSIQKDAILFNEKDTVLTEKEEYEELWKSFCRSITIQERKNPGLQQQLLPLKFRSNMPEFQ